jgi:hypothetical protein
MKAIISSISEHSETNSSFFKSLPKPINPSALLTYNFSLLAATCLISTTYQKWQFQFCVPLPLPYFFNKSSKYLIAYLVNDLRFFLVSSISIFQTSNHIHPLSFLSNLEMRLILISVNRTISSVVTSRINNFLNVSSNPLSIAVQSRLPRFPLLRYRGRFYVQ